MPEPVVTNASNLTTLPTSQTWQMQANKQAYDALTLAALNATEFPTNYDPIYGKLIEQISQTVYHKMRYEQMWRGIGTEHAPNSYPGILREIAMMRRKGMNYPMDNGNNKPTKLNVYDIYNDEIQVRYHAMQLRWMYGYTMFDEELRRFSGGNGGTIGQLTEMKAIGAASARNIFMDALRKKVLSIYANQVATKVKTTIDISNFDTLTTEQAKAWLNMIDNLLFMLWVGTNKYNGLGELMQTPKDRLKVAIPRQYWLNVIRRAFPDTYHTEEFQGIMPENMNFMDDLGDTQVYSAGDTPAPITPTFDAKGMNLLNWNSSSNVQNNSKIQCVIYDKFAIGFEDNLNEVLTGPKDIEVLATPVRMHYWTKAYVTDMVAGLAVTL